MTRISKKQFWTYMRNFSGIGAIVMLTVAFVSAQMDLTELPIGGDVSTAPEVGSVWSCTQTFNGRGASGDGSWINEGAGTFDFTAKAIVDGAVNWNGEFEAIVVGENRIFTGNQVPTTHTTGVFPIASSDDAYQYDRNPNAITELDFDLAVPANPTMTDTGACLNMGAIGIMRTGVVFFNSLDAEGRDAVAYESQDACDGHPESTGEYHYHNLSQCLEELDNEEGHSALMGYAFDGFGLYGHRGEDGDILTNEDLDECHGHTHLIEWDGEMVEMYHYHATYEYPYTLGCYRGTPVVEEQMMGQPQNGGGQQQQQQQPPEGSNGNPPPPQGNGNGNRPPNNGNPPPPGNR